MKIYGPYTTYRDPNHPRRFVILHWPDGHKKTMSYARHLMTQHLGRELTADEHVDHIDDDQLNDDLSNLQILTPKANRAKQAKGPEMVQFICPICEKLTEKRANQVRHGRKQGKAGPFCGKQCARQYQLAKPL